MLLGRVGRKDFKYTQSGMAVLEFSLAMSEKRTNKESGEVTEKTEWSNCKSFGKQAETLEKFVKVGDQLFINGKLQTSTWDKDDGTKMYRTEVIVNNFDFIGGKKDSAHESHPKIQKEPLEDVNFSKTHLQTRQPQAQASFASDDVPF